MRNFKLKALALDPDTEARMRLKQGVVAVPCFRQIDLAASLAEAQVKLSADPRGVDVVFVAERIPPEQAQAFIQQMKNNPQAQDAAYILLVKDSEDMAAVTAKSLLAGYDGCLMEPYSVTALAEITELSCRIKGERQDAREKIAIGLLVKDVMKHLDHLAYIKVCQADVGTTLNRLKDSSSAFATLDEKALIRYYQVALEQFEKVSPSSFISPARNYRGVSKRVKKKMIKKLIESK